MTRYTARVTSRDTSEGGSSAPPLDSAETTVDIPDTPEAGAEEPDGGDGT
ncbi:hypothetical protein [Streptomyces sp. CS014]|nr:hypothetical protein [Streptomyces sp. CS014]